ncbi:HAAS signaling domain-containing protein [Streptomyces sp. NPDC018026]|uniref:HAAS signaling domain-containing protein n=1 Tax=Streptomyces sp. NPDC018026 TaxID=3365031 RepID=UPI0037B509B9
MKTPTSPADLVRDYLGAVEREAAALPADRRQELLADLAEHIDVTRADRPDAAPGEILAELGDPRTIAATALAEAGSGGAGAAPALGGAVPPVRRGRVHPLVPLLMLTLPYLVTTLLPDVPGLALCSGLIRIAGGVLLCTSVHWTPVRKVVGVVLALVAPTVAGIVWRETTVAPAGDTPALVANLVVLAVVAGTSAWLWRARRG